ncbi:hypothetical protein ZWY2020_007648 [Hordeum vulgare]|nr:hypothetical protein ZWY2020_007648 [Hordeum vulgare]
MTTTAISIPGHRAVGHGHHAAPAQRCASPPVGCHGLAARARSWPWSCQILAAQDRGCPCQDGPAPASAWPWPRSARPRMQLSMSLRRRACVLDARHSAPSPQ